jgi:bifunctional ADP-heptose synthase (sugar kinase/adenylyltransferase)
VIAALACVDAVVVFDAAAPHDVIAAIQPDVLVKSADPLGDGVSGRDPIEARVLELRGPTPQTHAATHDVEDRHDGKGERQDH